MPIKTIINFRVLILALVFSSLSWVWLHGEESSRAETSSTETTSSDSTSETPPATKWDEIKQNDREMLRKLEEIQKDLHFIRIRSMQTSGAAPH